jgi:hypothetical protein
MAIRVCSIAGLLGLLLTLGSGCNPCCSNRTVAADSAPPGEAKTDAEPGQPEKAGKTKEVTLAVTGMT